MNVRCRNVKCEHHTRMIDTARHPLKCPLCGTPLANDDDFDESTLPPIAVSKPNPPPIDPRSRDRDRKGSSPLASAPPPAPDRNPYLPHGLHLPHGDENSEIFGTVLPPGPFSAPVPSKNPFTPAGPKPPSNPEIPRRPDENDRPLVITNKTRNKSEHKPKPKPRPEPVVGPFGAPAPPVDHGQGTYVEFPKEQAAIPNKHPKFMLERVVDNRFDPVKLIDDQRETPLYGSEGKGRRHLANLQSTPQGIQLTPMDSLNGVAIRIKSPVRLRDGRRFRIGNYLIEARESRALADVEPKVEEGERFFAQDLNPKAELVFFRPDGTEGFRFPLLKKIYIGRGRPGDPLVDIPLHDDNVSRRHASISLRSTGLKLRNLSTTNGTFVQIQGPVILGDADYFRLGEMVLRLVNYRTS